jgi:hypothetical protein
MRSSEWASNPRCSGEIENKQPPRDDKIALHHQWQLAHYCRVTMAKKVQPNIDWKEGQVTFDSTRYARECLDASLHATTIAEERAIGQYYLDTAPDVTRREMAYGTAMLDQEEGHEWQDEEETEEAMTREYVKETIREWGHDDDIEETIQEWRQDDDIEEPMTMQQ